MVQAPNKFTPPGSAGNDGVERRPQDQLCLFAGVLLTNVPEELKEADIPRQVAHAEATKNAQIRFEYGEQALCPILVHIPTRVFFLLAGCKFRSIYQNL